MATPSDVVFLVPGFFGFSKLGALNYFVGVESVLGRALRRRGVDVDIRAVPTQPTASLRRRAARLLREVAQHAARPEQRLHFVGHSTGGLDARLLVTPGVRVTPEPMVEEQVGARTRSVITVSTPHYGTPLANFCTTAFGRQILYLMSALATTQARRSLVAAAAQLTVAVAGLGGRAERDRTVLTHLSDHVLSRISGAEENWLWEFLREVRADQGALIQLTAEAADLFNAAVVDRPGVYYGCLCTSSPPPKAQDTRSPLDLGLYRIIWSVSSRPHRSYGYPHPGPGFLETWGAGLPWPIDVRANDGVVPTLSQVYGEPLDVVQADHLDIVGQYRRTLAGERHVSWLKSGSHFGDERFEASWGRVADAIAAAVKRRVPAVEARPFAGL